MRAWIPVPSHATVSDGALATSYLRAGSGRPTVVLGGASLLGPADWRGLCAVLKLIIPDHPAVGESDAFAVDAGFDAWLRGFVDGLGLERPHLIAGPAAGLAALAFAIAEPGRVARLVLLQAHAPATRPHGDAVADRLELCGVPVLVAPGLPRADGETDPSASREQIIRFLVEGTPDRTGTGDPERG
jgi:pimeloyl-ACP methyl ester carboxylesterase